MLKNEWLKRENDISSNSSKVYIKELCSHINKFLVNIDISIVIDDSKSIEDCFLKMKEYARAHQENNCFCFSDDDEEKFIFDYLGIKESKATILSLSDFI